MKVKMCAAILLAASLLTSCKKFLDINDNPSYPQDVRAEILLAPIIFHMANGYSQDQTIMNKFNQSIMGASTDDASKVWERHGFRLQSDVGGVMWRMVYFNHGRNLANMIDDAVRNEKYEYAAIGYAVKAWGYQMLTDYHGPVIMKEALRDKLSFAYDDQKEVYAQVRVWCDSALYYMDKKSPLDYSANLNSEKGDNLFRGNMSRWRKFVYGLRALQYIHLVNKPEFKGTYADSVVYYVDQSLSSNDDDAAVKFLGDKAETSSVVGPLYGVYTSSYYSRAGQPIVSYLSGGLRGTVTAPSRVVDDPRLLRMINRNLDNVADTVFSGALPNVSNSATIIPSILGKIINNVYEGKFIFRDKAEFPLMTYAQLQLVKAEALFIKGDLVEAYSAYLKAIRAHMLFVNRYINTNGETPITEGQIAAYLVSSEIPQSASDLKLSDIMGQKYIVQWGWGGMEQWCDLRKYHYDTDVFKQYQALSGSGLQYQEYCYRVRPRYNSEYVWNAVELDKWGALDPYYVTKPTWFVTTEN